MLMPYTGGKQQRAQDERVRGKERRDIEASRRLPHERLPVMADGLALPFEDAEEMEQHMRVRIAESLHEPRRRAAHGDSQLFG